MPPLIRLTPELREDFVAYLDGELDDATNERIEAVMAQSNVARNDIECLARSYELLELLPSYEASPDFAAQTLASIRVAELTPDFRQARWYHIARSAFNALLWIAFLGAVMGIGFVATRWGIPSRDDLLLRDFQVIEKLDTYAEVGSVEFLQLLSRQDTLLEEMARESRREISEDRR